jgi:hypothetical protein
MLASTWRANPALLLSALSAIAVGLAVLTGHNALKAVAVQRGGFVRRGRPAVRTLER